MQTERIQFTLSLSLQLLSSCDHLIIPYDLSSLCFQGLSLFEIPAFDMFEFSPVYLDHSWRADADLSQILSALAVCTGDQSVLNDALQPLFQLGRSFRTLTLTLTLTPIPHPNPNRNPSANSNPNPSP